jgi:hypothetical protein
MHAIQTRQRTNAAGTLALTIPLGQPDTEFEVLVVVQPDTTANGAPAVKAADNPYATMDAIRKGLAATGADFGDSADDIREDRDR